MNPDVTPLHEVVRQYVKHQRGEPRGVSGKLNIGAYEFGGAPVEITTDSLPSARRGRFYDQNLQASGGSGNFLWTVSAGSLPTGLRLDSSTGKISGKPAIKGVWNFTVTAQDILNPANAASAQFTLETKLF